MRIPCPYCGERDAEEFSIQGEVAAPRPEGGYMAAFHTYVHLRANEYGPTREYWYHANGCRRWLVVARDTRDHSILAVELAQR
jgi:heterotetrameric sarcosine oxidase delta subunit